MEDKLEKRELHENIKKNFEPLTDTIKDTSRDITKTMTETSINNNEALEKLTEEVLGETNDRGIIATYLFSPPYEFTNPEHTSQYKLIKDPDSNRVNVLITIKTVPFTLYNNLFLFRDTHQMIDFQKDFLKMMTNKNFNVDLAKLWDKKIMYDLGKVI